LADATARYLNQAPEPGRTRQALWDGLTKAPAATFPGEEDLSELVRQPTKGEQAADLDPPRSYRS
jgi:hypothetical protein